MSSNINWKIISEAIDFFSDCGYTYIETPWIVPMSAIEATYLGKTHILKEPKSRALVGSAEQSFIHMMEQGLIHSRKYVSAGPCFRHCKTKDKLHKEYFFKVELISILDYLSNPENELKQIIEDAKLFFSYNSLQEIKKVKTCEGYDLTLNDIEIGSYGLRTYNNYNWVYGTGVAEPRFSMAKDFF
jgi:seryl-tRNA synthetase